MRKLLITIILLFLPAIAFSASLPVASGMTIDNSTVTLGAGNTMQVNAANAVQRAQALNVIAANSSITLPANARILDIIVTNNNANAITGGLKIGTTAGGVDIATGFAVGANAFVSLGTGLLKNIFSASATQQVFIDAVTLWNGANINVTILYVILS